MPDVDVIAILGEIEAGNFIKAYDQLQKAVAVGTAEPQLRYLFVLVLARMGIVDRALLAYEELGIARMGTVDAKALYARLLKDQALALTGAGRAVALSQAANAYRAVYDDTGNHYPAINAASLFALAGRLEEANELAAGIVDTGTLREPEYYDLATKAEAQIILHDYAGATETLCTARKAPNASVGARAGTRRQIKLLLDHHKATEEQVKVVLGALSTGASVFFSGHMFREDAPIETTLRGQVRDTISERDVVAAFGSLSCGADIVIAEELLACDVPLIIALASPRGRFVETSVRIGGPGWIRRFEECLGAASEVHIVNDVFHASDPLAFALTARMAMGMARNFADQNVCEVLGLFVLGGKEAADETAGTNADLARWLAAGREAKVISADDIDRALPLPRVLTDGLLPFRRREVSLLFADFVGFSGLSDNALPAMIQDSLTAMAEILGHNDKQLLFRNTWGDACFAVFSDPIHAAEVAVKLLARLMSGELMNVLSGVRMSLHHGIAMEMFDPVLGTLNYFGREVSRAARIEPITPPNCIYASRAFVNAAAGASAKRLRFEYVGLVPLPKTFGEERLYRLAGIDPEV